MLDIIAYYIQMASRVTKRTVNRKVSPIVEPKEEETGKTVKQEKQEEEKVTKKIEMKLDTSSDESSESSSSESEDEVIEKPIPQITKFEVNEVNEAPQEVSREKEKKSVADFDHDEIRKLDVGLIHDTDVTTLLKILVVRGKDTYNPALWGGSQRLLRQLHCEFDDRRERDSRSNGGNYRGGRGGGRGGYYGNGRRYDDQNRQQRSTYDDQGKVDEDRIQRKPYFGRGGFMKK